jgi:hypothetical protein
MHIGSIVFVLACLMLIGALWVHVRDPHPEDRRDKLAMAAGGLLGLQDLTKDMRLPIGFDFHDLTPLWSVLLVLVAIIVPTFGRSKDRAANTPGHKPAAFHPVRKLAVSASSRCGPPSWRMSGFGTGPRGRNRPITDMGVDAYVR